MHEPNTGKVTVVNVSIDSPALLEITNHHLHHVKRFASTFLAENENQTIRIIIPARLNSEPDKENTKKN